MLEAHKIKVGLFVFTGIILCFICFFLLGLSEVFRDKVYFTSLFDESVQGLEKGAPVKFRGVTIGEVRRIAIRPVDNLIQVDMEGILASVEPGWQRADTVPAKKREKQKKFFKNMLTQGIKNGLRCKLEMAGITGVMFIEIDYIKKENLPHVSYIPPKKAQYFIPSVPSTISQIMEQFQTAITKVASIDFENISKSLESSLNSIESHLNNPKINESIDEMHKITVNVNKTIKNINETLSKKEMKVIVGKIKNSIKSFNTLLKDSRKKLQEAKIAETGEVFREKLDSTSLDVSDSLQKLNSTLETLSELAEYLEEDPSSIIRGKHKKPIFSDEQN